MNSNYPSGVTGNEYEIAGPDYEHEVDAPCPDCHGHVVMEQGYRHERWLACPMCGWTTDLEPLEFDPDRAYDEARERKLFGDEYH